MTEEKTKQMIAQWLDGSISREEFAELEQVLAACPEARAYLRREVNLDSVLREQAAMNAGLDAWTSATPPARTPGRRKFWLAATLAGCAALLLSLGAFLLGGRNATNHL